MPVNVDIFKKTAEFVMNKSQSGNTVAPAQFSLVADQAQLQVYEEDRLVFLKTGESSDYLDWFLKNTIINPNPLTGYGSYPNDFQHTAGVRAYYNGVERPVELVENKAWGEVQASELMTPTRLFPKYTEFLSEYRFLPKNIGIVMLDYWKRPAVPVWKYTIVNNVPVYTPVGSVDFEWEAFSFNRVLSVYLQLCGCNLKDKDLSQFANEFKSENKSLL
jgi:hypothetical protein